LDRVQQKGGKAIWPQEQSLPPAFVGDKGARTKGRRKNGKRQCAGKWRNLSFLCAHCQEKDLE
jgi:hypothetical protein